MGYELFEPDREWLAQQPAMKPWEKGVGAIMDRLKTWADDYYSSWCGEAVGEQRAVYAARLWGCWGLHWNKAAQRKGAEGRADGFAIANELEQGRGANGELLGGNPLSDVVLAEAVCRNNAKARKSFYNQFVDFALATGAKIWPPFRNDESFWSDLVGKLAGDLKPPGKLKQFTGRSCLRRWLGVVIGHEALNRRETLQAQAQAVHTHAPAPKAVVNKTDDAVQIDALDVNDPVEALMSAECRGLVQRAIGAALGELPPKDRLILSLLFVDQLSGKDVAKIVGVHAGNITRRKEAALAQLQGGIDERRAASDAVDCCVEHLLRESGGSSLGAEIMSALQTQAVEAPAP